MKIPVIGRREGRTDPLERIKNADIELLIEQAESEIEATDAAMERLESRKTKLEQRLNSLKELRKIQKTTVDETATKT